MSTSTEPPSQPRTNNEELIDALRGLLTKTEIPAEEPAPTPEPNWAKPSVSVIGLSIFALGYAISFVMKDSTVQTMFAGAAIAMGQQVIGYWLGSSSGSTKKDATIAAAASQRSERVIPNV